MSHVGVVCPGQHDIHNPIIRYMILDAGGIGLSVSVSIRSPFWLKVKPWLDSAFEFFCPSLMEAQGAQEPKVPCLFTLQEVKELSQVSVDSWRAIGTIVAKCGLVEGIIDGEPAHFEFTEWEDRDFVADLRPRVRPPG